MTTTYHNTRLPLSHTYQNILLPLSQFIQVLKQHGFIIGIDHYVRVQQIIAGVPINPTRLKYVLCPLFATNPKDQHVFYDLFDRFFQFPIDSSCETPSCDDPNQTVFQEDKKPRKYRLLIIKLWVLLFMIGCVLGIGYMCLSKQPKIDIKPVSVHEEILPNPIDQTPLTKLTITLNHVPDFIPQPTFYQTYGLAIRWIAILLPVLIFLAGVWIRFKKRQIILEKREGTKAPSDWFRVCFKPPNVFFLRTKQFYHSTMRLRRRLQSDIKQLDIHSTVESTIQASGYPVFCYHHLTRPPEYLILIQITDHKDHFAGLADALYQELKQEDICVTRYFFYHDPRICFQLPDDEKKHYLSDMVVKYQACRLIIYTQGDHFLDPYTGKLESWLSPLTQFSNRAILTSNATSQWGLKEVKLSSNFIVLPATIDGLYALVSYFEYPNKYHLKQWIEKGQPGMPAHLIHDMDALKENLGPACFRWLCACAIYPELHWHLTICIGQKLLSKEELTESHVIQLIRLPWFKKGSIPDDIRYQLIQALEPTDHTKVRQTIINVLDDNKVEQGAPGFDIYTLNMAIQKWSLLPESRQLKKRVVEHLERLTEDEICQDYTLIRLLDTLPHRSPLSFILPHRFYTKFYNHHLPILGLKTSMRLLRTLVFVCLAFIFIQTPEPYRAPETKTIVSFDFVKIKAGTFMMGSPETEPGRNDDEVKHQVTIEKEYYMQTTEVTQGQWKAVMNKNPSYFSECGDDCPVELISWDDVQGFIQRLNDMEKDYHFRLPTEAEWEYAARGGSKDALYTGPIDIIGDNNAPALDPIAWYGGNSCVTYKGGWDCSEWSEKQMQCDTCGPHQVGRKQPNQFGLYDVIGNVWEWCHDWYGDYPKNSVIDVGGPKTGSSRVCRGGAWLDLARYCRPAFRFRFTPDYRLSDLGCRLLVVPSSAE